MELRCLLGHDFGQREVERERREEGDEVVVVYRTVEACDRCGTRRVLSENTEVRSIRPAAPDRDDRPSGADGGDAGAEGTAGTGGTDGHVRDAGGVPDGEPDAERSAPDRLVEAAEAGGSSDAGGDAGADDPTTDDAVILSGGDGPDDAGDRASDPADRTGDLVDDAGDPAGDDGDPAGDDGTSPEQRPADDATLNADGEPIDGSPTEGDRSDGAAPADAAADGEPGATDGASATASEPGVELLGDGSNGSRGESTGTSADAVGGGWPTRPDAADEGYDAVPHDDTDAGVDFGGGLVPTGGDDGGAVGSSTDDTGEAEDRDQPAPGTGAEFVTADDVGATDADGETELRCPNCEASWPAAGSSLRSGDICPDCHRGYVAERPVER